MSKESIHRYPQTVDAPHWLQSAKKVARGGRDRPWCNGIARRRRLGRLRHADCDMLIATCWLLFWPLICINWFHIADKIPVKKQSRERVCFLQLTGDQDPFHRSLESIWLAGHDISAVWRQRKHGYLVRTWNLIPSDLLPPPRFSLLKILQPFREQPHRLEARVQTL